MPSFFYDDEKKDLCVRVARWALLLEEFEYTIEHRPGRSMMHVDALSRNPAKGVMLVSESKEGFICRFRRVQQEDEELRRILDLTKEHAIEGFIERNGLLLREINNELLMVVPNSLQTQVIRQAHEQGHFATNKTEAIVQRDYWFRGMRENVEKVVRNCINCILAERKHWKQEGYLNPIDKGESPLNTFHIDHLGPMSSTKKRYRYIFVVVDSFTKFVWLYPTRSTNIAEDLERLKGQAGIFGNPKRIVSDRGAAFTSNAMKEYCEVEGIQHILITTGVPRGNGQGLKG